MSSAAESSDGSEVVRLGTGHCSMIGTRPTMEDAIIMERSVIVKDKGGRVRRRLALFAVFDGHGGSNCSDYLSQNCTAVMAQHLSREDCTLDVSRCMEDAILELDELCIEHASDGSGSTGVIVLLDKVEGSLWVANVGDSRCILLSDDDAVQLSVEHKPTDPEERKRIMDADGWVAYGRVMGILAVSRSFGDRDFKRHSSGLVIVTPSITHHRLSAKDEYLVIACDGLFDVFSNEDVQKFINLANALYPDLTLDQLATDIVTAAIKERHSRDNVSTILVKLYVDGIKDSSKSEARSGSSSSSSSSTIGSRTVPSSSAASTSISGAAAAAHASSDLTSSSTVATAASVSDRSATAMTDSSTGSGTGGLESGMRSERQVRRRIGASVESEDESTATGAGSTAAEFTAAMVGLDITPSAIGGVVRGGRRP